MAKDDYATDTDFFSTFYNRLGSPTAQSFNASQRANLSKPSCGAGNTCIYYAKGPVTTSTNVWNVLDNEKIIILIANDTVLGNGNLAIRKDISITGGGFISFIVQGDIAIDTGVGVQENNTSPVVHGVYIANGIFKTGASTSVGKAKFVAKGMFIANIFTLERDLEDVGADNIDNPAHIFEYNPQFLVTMPPEMMSRSYTWQEVAP